MQKRAMLLFVPGVIPLVCLYVPLVVSAPDMLCIVRVCLCTRIYL